MGCAWTIKSEVWFVLVVGKKMWRDGSACCQSRDALDTVLLLFKVMLTLASENPQSTHLACVICHLQLGAPSRC